MLTSRQPNPANLEISGTVLLEGAGQVTLDGASDSIIGASGGGILDNINDTISGAGTIGTGGSGSICQVDNGGVIDADLQNQSLTLDPTSLPPTPARSRRRTVASLSSSARSIIARISGGTVGAYSGGYVYFQGAITGGSAIIDGGVLEMGKQRERKHQFRWARYARARRNQRANSTPEQTLYRHGVWFRRRRRH